MTAAARQSCMDPKEAADRSRRHLAAEFDALTALTAPTCSKCAKSTTFRYVSSCQIGPTHSQIAQMVSEECRCNGEIGPRPLERQN